MSRRIFLSIVLALALVGLTPFRNTAVNAAKPQTYVGELAITPQPGDRVFGDGVFPTYTDYQLYGTSQPKTYCVLGSVDTSGMAFFGLDRGQGFATDQWCNLQLDNPPPPDDWAPRRFTLLIGDATACNVLGLPFDLVHLWCTLVSPVPPIDATLQPHVRADTVFKTKATKTPVIFDFTPATPSGGIAYRVVTEQDAPIVASESTADSKKVRYLGKAHLKYTGVNGATIGGSFDLPFTMTFKRIVLP